MKANMQVVTDNAAEAEKLQEQIDAESRNLQEIQTSRDRVQSKI